MIIKIKKLYSKLDIHTAEVVRKSAASTIIKVSGMAVGLGISIFLGRTIGADGLGIINLSIRIVSILIVMSLLGIPQVIVKELAIAQNNKDYNHIRNVMHTAYWLNGSITLFLSIIFILLTPYLANNIFKEPRLIYPLIIALLVMMPQVLSRIFSSALVGFKKIWQSNLVEQTLSMLVAGLLLMILWLFDKSITVNRVAVIYAIGRITVTIAIGTYWFKLFKNRGPKKIIIHYLLRTSLPLFVVSISAIVLASADIIILGWLRNPKDVGFYSIAARVSMLTSFFLLVTNTAISPKIAALYDRGKIIEIEKMVQQITKGLGFIGIVSFLTFIFFGKFILGLWGTEFSNSYWTLIILSFGQLINLATGAVGLVLIMTGYEKLYSKLSLTFTFISIILNILLIYYFGTIGAAITTTFVIAGSNIAKVVLVRKVIGINALPYL